jgi:hypothetical protein
MMPQLIHISQSPADFQRRRPAARRWAGEDDARINANDDWRRFTG